MCEDACGGDLFAPRSEPAEVVWCTAAMEVGLRFTYGGTVCVPYKHALSCAVVSGNASQSGWSINQGFSNGVATPIILILVLFRY